MKLLGLGMSVLIMATSLISCDKEENDAPGTEGTPTAQYGYKVSVNPTLLSFADITVTVTAEGEDIVTTLKDTVYKYNCQLDKFPATISANVTYNWKADLDTASLGKVDLYLNSLYSVVTYKADGAKDKRETKSGASINNTGVKGGDLYRLRDIHLRMLERTNYSINFITESNRVNYEFEN